VRARPEVAQHVLTTVARFVDGGMVPNRFAEDGETPAYNTVDAALWTTSTSGRRGRPSG
jgi:4-alpha-glucanotransferase